MDESAVSDLEPNALHQAKALFKKALNFQKQGDLKSAISAYNQMLVITPEAGDALNNLGVALRAAGQRKEAVVCYRRLLAHAPEKAATWVNLGNVLRELGQFDECEQAFKRALAIEPESQGALYGLGLVSRDINALDDSVTYFENALEGNPEDPDLNWDRALTLLRMGNYTEGFKAYEWRWKLARHQPRPFTQPEWDGSALNGRGLYIYSEQGFGDALQFLRFIPRLREAQGTDFILEVRPELKRLLSGQISGVREVVARGDSPPDFDCHVPLLSLPRVLGETVETIPKPPYIKSVATVDALPALSNGGLNIGLSWAGSPTQANDRNRTFPVSSFLPLLERQHHRFYSLQKGEAAKDLEGLGVRHIISPMGDKLRDFADTAAFVDQLDLVITADTAVAHLAGAMGRRVWIALSIFHDWRYDRTGSIGHWYPTARVFRQETPGDWEGVFTRIKTALSEIE